MIPSLSIARIIGLIGLIAGVGALLAGVVAILDQAADGRAARACEKAAASDAAVLDECTRSVAVRVQVARRADLCEGSLATLKNPSAAKPADLYAIRASCGANVKWLHATAEAATANLADAQAQIADARRSTDAAVARAEARAATLSTRKSNDEMVIAQQPRLADGRVRCDADCLRALDVTLADGRR